jgi:YegS/Rv2252/BmrU family lipid kinase
LETGPTVLVVNAAARQGEESAERARRALHARGVELDDVQVVPEPERLPDALRAAVVRRPSRLLVGGGDGTISLAAGLVAGTEIALGVLPLGTGNDFARNLRLPRDLEAACDVVAAGETRSVAVGLANGRVFLNALSLGVSAGIARRLTPELKRRAGPLAYPVAAAGEALAPEPFRVTLELPGDRRELAALQVVVGNGRFHGGGTLVAPGATIDDDLLDVYVVEAAGASSAGVDRARNAWRLARLGVLLARGRHLDDAGVLHLRCRELVLDAEPAQEVNADGELLARTPVRCEISPRRLRVLAPPVGARKGVEEPVEPATGGAGGAARPVEPGADH